jgi:hypothetical protein
VRGLGWSAAVVDILVLCAALAVVAWPVPGRRGRRGTWGRRRLAGALLSAGVVLGAVWVAWVLWRS